MDSHGSVHNPLINIVAPFHFLFFPLDFFYILHYTIFMLVADLITHFSYNFRFSGVFLILIIVCNCYLLLLLCLFVFSLRYILKYCEFFSFFYFLPFSLSFFLFDRSTILRVYTSHQERYFFHFHSDTGRHNHSE